MANEETEVNQLIFDFEDSIALNSSADNSGHSLGCKDDEINLRYNTNNDDDSELSDEDEDDNWKKLYLDTSSNSNNLSSSQRSGELSAIGSSGGIAQSKSIVDGLLCEIYDKNDDENEEPSSSQNFEHVTDNKQQSISCVGDALDSKLTEEILQNKSIKVLEATVQGLELRITQVSARLIKELKRRDRRKNRLSLNCDFLTAIIQACSLKRRQDTQLKFILNPARGKDGFRQWIDSCKALVRLPCSIPPEWRRKLWLRLAESKLTGHKWAHIAKFAFNEKSNRDDDKLGMQIVKDLHRTGYTKFCDRDRPNSKAALKRVLLGYARWNKAVGYCQGFNVIAALILEVFEGNEEQALKVMIYLIDYVLPKNYFASNLQALSVDMAVFRELLREEEPELRQHLDKLQTEAAEEAGSDYEPPLTNVFTMQWFLTIFATCLPRETVLRIWDSVLLEGSTVLVHTALALWSIIGERISTAENSHEFYSMMGYISQKMLEGKIVDRDLLIQKIYSIGPFPHPAIERLRDEYTYNITPFTTNPVSGPLVKRHSSTNSSNNHDSDDDDFEYVECPESPSSKAFPLYSYSEGEKQSKLKRKGYKVFKEETTATLRKHSITKVFPVKNQVSKELKHLRKQYSDIIQQQKNLFLIAETSSFGSSPPDDSKANSNGLENDDSPVINHLFLSKGQKWNKLYGDANTSSPNVMVVGENSKDTSSKMPGSRHLSLNDFSDDEGLSVENRTKSATDIMSKDEETFRNDKSSNKVICTSTVGLESDSISIIYGSKDTVMSYNSEESSQRRGSISSNKSNSSIAMRKPSSFNPFPTRGALEEKRHKRAGKAGVYDSSSNHNVLANSAALNRSKKIAEMNNIRAMIRKNKLPQAKCLSNEPSN